MTVQYSTTIRNDWLDRWEALIGASAKIEIRTGAPPANCAAADSGTLLATITLAADWADAAASGIKSLSNLPISTVAVAAGVAGHYRLKNNAATVCHEQGTLTATGGGGDRTIDITDLNIGDNVAIIAWSKTAPGA